MHSWRSSPDVGGVTNSRLALARCEARRVTAWHRNPYQGQSMTREWSYYLTSPAEAARLVGSPDHRVWSARWVPDAVADGDAFVVVAAAAAPPSGVLLASAVFADDKNPLPPPPPPP